MTACRTITINCTSCGTSIVTDEFDSIPEARRVAKEMGRLKVYQVKNGSMWDFCLKCAKTYKEGKLNG